MPKRWTPCREKSMTANEQQAEATISRQSASGSDEPSPQHERDPQQHSREAGIEQMKRAARPSSILKECLCSSFEDIEDFRNYCSEHFADVYKDLGASRFEASVLALIRHCETRSTVDYLWERIRLDRPHHYRTYYPRWQEAALAAGAASRRGTDFGSPHRGQRSAPETGSASLAHEHPLAQESEQAIRNWFYADLTDDERSLVLTTALFEGLDRKYIQAISQDLAEIVFGQPARVARSGR